jgi:hypothetical protein
MKTLKPRRLEMKSKSKVWIGLLCFVLILGSFSIAKADTILFPVIAVNQPNVTTIVSVFTEDHLTTPQTHLHYIYRYKDSLSGGSPNHTGSCATASFTRPTTPRDLVSFDASGTLNGGNALFNDTDSYGGSFSMPGSGPRRAYLLVTQSNASGTRGDCGLQFCLGGEAIIMDIAYGAAWGYRAINDKSSETYTFTNAADGGGVWSAMPGNGNASRRFAVFSPNEWTNKFFVTPIGANMDTANLSTSVKLSSDRIYDRMNTTLSFPAMSVSMTCTAAIDLDDMMDSTTFAAIGNTGGWGYFNVVSGDAIVYKLEYVVNNSTYGGTNNNGYLLSTYDLP